MVEVVQVHFDDQYVGAASFDPAKGFGAFEYDKQFISTGIELAPMKMPLSSEIYQFPGLDYAAFKGLPGLIADSLPDDFGNAVLDSYMAAQGRSTASITPIERLKFTGQRGMGALTFAPASPIGPVNKSRAVQIDRLVAIAQSVLDSRAAFEASLTPDAEDAAAMVALLSVGTSAGGARPKAVLAFDADFKQVRSGQVDAPEGFTHHLMKFDGVTEHRKGKETFGDPMGFGAMEYVYHLMAVKAGINMMPCRLLREGDRRHFLTQRFDRVGNKRVHIQTLNAMDHVSYKKPGTYSYEQLMMLSKELGLPAEAGIELLRRAAFNVVARNHDDHSKNFAFLLNDEYEWELAPAYDIAYSYKPGSEWVNSHWMTINGKRENHTREDFYTLTSQGNVFTKRRIDSILDEVIEAVSQWGVLSQAHEVPLELSDEVAGNLLLRL